jgi:putative MATE family efflux protein
MDQPARTLAPPAPYPRGAWWRLVREALAGSKQDFTEGPVGRALLLLAIPMVLETAMESAFAIVDVFFVGRLGAAAVATVGLTESMMALIYSVAMGLGIGATAMVARRTGEKDLDGAAHTAVQAIALGVLLSAVIAIVGGFQAERLLVLLGATPEIVDVGAGYTRVMLVGNGSVLLLFLLNAVFRGAGDAAIAMRVLWMANSINIVLDPCLIFGLGPFPEMGVTGAAVATTIGRGCAVLVQIGVLASRTGRIQILRRHLWLEPSLVWRLARLSGTGIFQILVMTTSWIGLVRILSSFGSDALAGYTIAVRIIIFALLPSWGLANAAATMVGQALGARMPERGERAVWLAGFYNLLFLGTVGLVFMVWAPDLVRIFSTEPGVVRNAVNCVRIVSAGFVFYAYGMVLTNSFNGAGDTWTPTYINLGCFWMLEVPLAWVLATRTPMGADGVYVAILAAFSSVAVVSALLFRRGGWKYRRV